MSEQIVLEIKDVSKSFNDQIILDNINLKIKHGEFLTLLGPSGCGKTTLLRMISGFEEPSSGSIFIDGKDAKGLPPHERHVHTVFQSYALFPHMTVFDNVAFGLRCSNTPEKDVKPRVLEALRMVKLEHFGNRKPAQLSGGQQQRVAIARAVVNRPLVLLLDEPLSSLDYRLRKTMQMELRQLQRTLGITFIFVTHDQEEALSMSDRVVVMSDGSITQIGTPRQVYEEPSCLSVAKFIGEVNIFETTVSSINDDKITVDIEGMAHAYPNRHHFSIGDKALVLVRPEDVRIFDSKEVKETENMYRGIVEDFTYKGTTVDLLVRLDTGKVISTTEFFDEDDDSLVYTLGEKVWLHWVNGWEVVLPYEE
ncbi:MAG: spermidine/putrescine ABC transporter ATP-binding protein PotA [Legionellales bacterium]|nr:spermidine/putrescine ABC transporter ATP-binding protein PotA [Legionellales bacterium]